MSPLLDSEHQRDRVLRDGHAIAFRCWKSYCRGAIDRNLVDADAMDPITRSMRALSIAAALRPAAVIRAIASLISLATVAMSDCVARHGVKRCLQPL